MHSHRFRIIRYTLYGVLLLALYTAQFSPRGFLVVGGVRPLLVLPFVIAVAMKEQETVGMAFGLAAGLLCDVSSPAGWPFHAVLFMLLGCAAGVLISRLMADKLRSALVLAAGALSVYLLARFIVFYVAVGSATETGRVLEYWFSLGTYSLLLTIPLYYLTAFIHRRTAP